MVKSCKFCKFGISHKKKVFYIPNFSVLLLLGELGTKFSEQNVEKRYTEVLQATRRLHSNNARDRSLNSYKATRIPNCAKLAEGCSRKLKRKFFCHSLWGKRKNSEANHSKTLLTSSLQLKRGLRLKYRTGQKSSSGQCLYAAICGRVRTKATTTSQRVVKTNVSTFTAGAQLIFVMNEVTKTWKTSDNISNVIEAVLASNKTKSAAAASDGESSRAACCKRIWQLRAAIRYNRAWHVHWKPQFRLHRP